VVTSKLIQFDDLKNFLNVVDDFVITSITDSRGIITDVSKAFCKISGYSTEELIGQPHNIVRHEDTPSEVFEDLWSTISSGKMWQGEIKNSTKDGGFYWVVSTIFPRFDEEHKIIGYISLRQDITDSKLLIERERVLKAQSKNAAMGEMISMIAHQWKQPLSSISAIAGNIAIKKQLDTLDLDTVESNMRDIQIYTSHLSDTATAFANFFNPKSDHDTILLSSVLSYSVQLIGPLLSENNIDLLYKCKNQLPTSFTESEPFYCSLDDHDLRLNISKNDLVQVLLNLIKNSVDSFITQQTVKPVIHINVAKENDFIIITLADNAGGIDKEIMKHIFSPYRTSKGDKGTGLGLYMCKIIIEEHLNGTISADNIHDGAQFTIKLPAV
jgi:PAS domain S-box-containing protein